MTSATPERKPCGTCGKEYTVTASGTIRHHTTDNPDWQAGPDSRKCKGAGQPPATPAGAALADDMAPWGVTSEAVAQPTMADQLAATPLTGALARETSGAGTVLDAMDGDMRAEAERFMAARVPEQTTARTEHVYTDPSGVQWTHPGAEESCQAPDCVTLRQASGGTRRTDRPEGFDPACAKCNTDDHRCPGCGTDVRHGVVACDACERELLARKLPPGRTEDGRRCEHHEAVFGIEDDRMVCVACGTPCTHPDGFQHVGFDENDEDRHACPLCGVPDPTDRGAGPDPELPNCPHPETHRAGCGCPDDDSRDPADAWRTPDDLMAKMPGDVRTLDSLRLNCAECGHPVTPLVDRFDWNGNAATVTWFCESAQMAGTFSCNRGRHECKPDPRVRLGDLDEGDYFVRRGTLMRLTERESSTSVLAVVVGGPYDGREGALKNLDEMVERAPEPRTTEQETKECTDETTPQQRLASPAVSATNSTAAATPTSPVPGSPQGTKASVQAVSPKSGSVTSSAPTAGAAGNGGSAAVTTDQSAAAAAFLAGGRPASSVTVNQPQDQAAAAAQFLAGGSGAHGEKETKRDRFGRYLIPHPDTGREQAWTRATTFAKSISDTYALSQWGLRMALLGATVRPDIVQRAHGKHVRADKQLLDELTAELKSAAGDKVAANLGTAMHSFTEMADRAWHSPGGPRSILDQVPGDARADVETYIRLLEETGLEPVPHLIEFTTVVKQYGVAGTSDNCYKVTRPLTLRMGRAEVRLEPGEYVIGDKKTGRDLDYGWQEIAIQLGTYAQGINTAGVWDREDEVWEPDPLSRFDKPGTKVRTDAGIVIHLPVDAESEKQPAVYGVDLESGWNAAVLCERVRAWRKVRNLASPVMVSEADTFAPSRPEPTVTSRTTVRPPTLREKANAVTSKGEASAVWQEATKAGLPQAEVDDLVSVMQRRLAGLEEKAG